MATHGFTRIEPWPVDEQGRDLSVIRNQADGPVSLFTYGTREGFVGVYHPHTKSGTVHVASPSELPTHKVWSWGHDARRRTGARPSRTMTARSRAAGGAVPQSGDVWVSRAPGDGELLWSWLPVRDLGGITRANVDAVMHMERTTPTHVRIALDVTRDLPDARITIHGGTSSFDKRVSLSPRDTWRWEGDEANGGTPVRFEVIDADGHPVIAHTENRFDRTPAAAAPVGPQASFPLPHGAVDVDGTIERGRIDELEGRRQIAMARYEAALRKYPESRSLLKAAGRLAVSLGWADSESDAAAETIRRLERALAGNTTDMEVQYLTLAWRLPAPDD